jgi:hypothetical protein
MNAKLKVLITVEGLPGHIFSIEHFLDFSRELHKLPSTIETSFAQSPGHLVVLESQNESQPCICGCHLKGR